MRFKRAKFAYKITNLQNEAHIAHTKIFVRFQKIPKTQAAPR